MRTRKRDRQLDRQITGDHDRVRLVVSAGMRVIVVGSGVAGAGAAFALADGGADVVVVDRVRPGQATAAGAGIVQPWSSRAEGPTYELYAAGAAYYPTLVGRLAEVGVEDIGHRVTGSLVVDRDPARLVEVERRLHSRGVGFEHTDGLFPPLAPDLHALYVPRGARVDGRRLRAGLLEGARRRGATVVDALAVGVSAGTVRLADRELAADAVVVAAGAWVRELVDLPVEPQRGQIAHLLLDGVDTGGWPSVLPLADHYLVPFEGGRVVVGATRETGSGFDPRVTAAGIRQVLTDAMDLAPGLAQASLVETRVGLRPAAAEPIVGPVAPGLYVSAGFGAAGLTMAPAAGERLARLILG
jgi:D-amino-acid dehydrogenase